ncbi:MAG: macrocin O-methyltransferase [Desulfobacteraceae bacterium]|nr:MAG: macrocin O-methyltransferase [Desulfobacteraceae bacterium]
MIKKAIRSVLRKLGYDIVKYNDNKIKKSFPPDFERRHIEIIERVRPYTITSLERIYVLIESVQYILRNDIKGDFLECGVYKGGSMMTIALTLMAEGVRDRELYFFDTFEAIPAPDERDIDLWGTPALERFPKDKNSDVNSICDTASLASVKQAMVLTGYPMERIHFIKGLVENTIPEKAPESIALLRLDTDWYQSTIHELTHLYPNVTPKGIIIVDDYGHYKGAREAVDEYFQKNKMMPFLHRIDYTGRLIIKYK